MRSALAFLTVVTLFSPLAAAQESGRVELMLRPRAIESPLFQYRLFPAESEIRPGNAVPILLRLPWEQTLWMTNVFPKLDEWETRPLDSPEWAKFVGVLPENFYREMKRAAFRRDAEWEYPLQETETPYLILLPDVQGLRGFLAKGLSARIRYHLSRGELDQAREGILVGLANGRHLSQTPFFVNQLVAAAIHRTMLQRTEELISQPNSPNLYWALSTLPDSLLQVDRAADLESNIFAMTLPAADHLDRPRSDEEWSEMAKQLVELLREFGELPREEEPKDRSFFSELLQRLNLASDAQLAAWVGLARTELPKWPKYSQEQVAAMSDDEAAVRWYVEQRLVYDHRIAAILSLPPREALPQIPQLQQELSEFKKKSGAKGMEFLSPATLYVSLWSVRRRIDGLRVIEAVRHHLATHNGKLPDSLSEIRGIPIPDDPLTGQPFQWSVEGNTATLKAPPLTADLVKPGSDTAKMAAAEYRLRTP